MADEVEYEALPSNAGLGVNMLAGAMAGISEHAVMFPIDSIKTRMQVITASDVAVYSSLGNAVQRIASTEGLRTLWRGVASVIMGAGPAHAVHFGTYEAVKELAGGNTGGHHPGATLFAGACATIASDALMNPFDVIKQRMQIKDSAFRSVLTCARTVYRNEGLTAFYISYPTTLTMSVPFTAVQFTAYESIKRILNPTDKYSPITHVTAGGLAGGIAAAITTPLDVAKTLLQTRGSSNDPQIRNARGMRDAFRIIYERNGLRGFSRGLTPRVVTFMPSNALCWLCYEFFKTTIRTDEARSTSFTVQLPLNLLPIYESFIVLSYVHCMEILFNSSHCSKNKRYDHSALITAPEAHQIQVNFDLSSSMQPARRRTNSKATINYGFRNSSYPEGKNLTGFLDQAERDPNSISWRSYFGNLRAVRRASRKNSLFIIIGLLFICWISWPTIRASTRVANRHFALVTYPKPFPNFESLPIGGKRALEALQAKGSPISCPSQATFVIPLADRNLRSTIPLIARLQETSCPIHLLVERDQLKETEDVLQVVLPATELIVIVPVMFESDGVALTTLHHVKSVQTPWVWLMGPADDKTWRTLDLDDFARGVQKFPRADFLLGIYGARVHESKLSCVPQTNQPEPVAFLVPPFLAPTSLLLRAELGTISGTSDNIWASLGGNIARVTGLGMGGALAPTTYFGLETCQTPHTWTAQSRQVSKAVVDLLNTQLHSSTLDAVRYAFMLPNMESLHLLAPTACRMIQNGHEVHISIRTNSSERNSGRQQLDFGCHLHYYPDAPTAPSEGRFELAHSINMWCLSVTPEAKVIIATELDDDLGRDQLAFVKRLCPGTTAAINLPFNDLQDSEWLSMLTPQEWQAWNTPQIELAVVTHDRPWSLARLLNSIKRAHYFGDAVNIVINLEQTADLQTRRIAETFSMNLNGGHVAVRHRIVYAGLMTAVVESWHPHGNHSYGVILEDDVELSPMFYAWIKFCVLRYRYDTRNNQSSQLYGVSLYQPKVTELRMEGRRMFDPKGIFSKLELEYPHTPYLSQVPCSWGAVYFPEHWREFQRYLALRLSEYSMPVNEIVVPNLRSNKWSRSWKKFFNEMVFLRGYVSLYPNYVHFVSLSTNHLEMGEHVPANVNQEKQAQYFLPLMQDTAIARLYPETERGVKFLDLPAGNLPLWSTLPVLDLWGDVSSLDKLQAVGLAWRANMSACNPDESYEDALQFLCPFGKNTHSFSKLYGPLSSTTVDDDGPDLMQG